MNLPAPFDLSAIEFLCGPDSDEDNLDVDPIFAKRLEDVVADVRAFSADGLCPVEGAPVTPSLVASGYSFVEVGDGILLLSPDGETVGAYLSCDLVVDSAHQGRGLGAELVVERALRHGDLPTWHLDKAAYTPAGYAAHEAAWQFPRRHPAAFAAKAAAIDQIDP